MEADEFMRRGFPQPAEPADLPADAASIDDYSDREGYESDFLGERFPVSPPRPVDRTDRVPVTGAADGRPFELCYHHFSVVMSRKRRLCSVTAVNIDGAAPFFRPPRPGWRTDPRIPAAAQVDGAGFYVPEEFDGGHMVRRLDPVWGAEATARAANRDTHHYTNACPQVHSFNDGMWGDLEDSILGRKQTRAARASVFTGPVFHQADPVYSGVQVPVRFYKVVAVVDDERDRLSVTAFRLDQPTVLPPPGGAVRPSSFEPGGFRMHQVTVDMLAEETGIDFGVLQPADVLLSYPLPAGMTASRIRIPVRSSRDVVVHAR